MGWVYGGGRRPQSGSMGSIGLLLCCGCLLYLSQRWSQKCLSGVRIEKAPGKRKREMIILVLLQHMAQFPHNNFRVFQTFQKNFLKKSSFLLLKPLFSNFLTNCTHTQKKFISKEFLKTKDANITLLTSTKIFYISFSKFETPLNKFFSAGTL